MIGVDACRGVALVHDDFAIRDGAIRERIHVAVRTDCTAMHLVVKPAMAPPELASMPEPAAANVECVAGMEAPQRLL